MIVQVKVYRVFFEKLWEKFNFKEKQHIADSSKVVDIWESTMSVNGRVVAITKERFSASPLYFYKLRPKKAIKEGEIEVSNIPLAKALAYIEDIEQEERFQYNDDWENEAKTLLRNFEQEYIDAKIQNKAKEEGKIKKGIPGILTSPDDIPELKLGQELIEQFFKDIEARNYHEAWTLLTPKFQNSNGWFGSIKKFEDSFHSLVRMSSAHVSALTYQYARLEGIVEYSETLNKYQLNEIFELAENKPDVIPYLCYVAVEEINRTFGMYYNDVPLNGFDFPILKDIEFQRTLFRNSNIQLAVKHISAPRPIEYQHRKRFVLDFYHGQWMIENIEGFEPARLADTDAEGKYWASGWQGFY